MKLLLTGRHGFIGKNILKDLDHEFITPKRKDYIKAIRGKDYDMIIHCAWAGTYKKSTKRDYLTNVRLLSEIAATFKPAIVFGSGADAFDEDNWYVWGKKYLARLNFPQMLKLRLYGVYGKGEDPSRFIPTAIRSKRVHIDEDVLMGFVHIGELTSTVNYYTKGWYQNEFDVVGEPVYLSEIAKWLHKAYKKPEFYGRIYAGFNNTGLKFMSVRKGLKMYEAA